MAKSLSAEEAKDRLDRLGKTTVDVAGELNVPVAIVRGVLSGKLRGSRGDAHKVAVALGLKDGLVVGNDVPLAEAMKAAAR